MVRTSRSDRCFAALTQLHHLETRAQNIPNTLCKKTYNRVKNEFRRAMLCGSHSAASSRDSRLKHTRYSTHCQNNIQLGRVKHEFRRAMLRGSHSAASSRDSRSKHKEYSTHCQKTYGPSGTIWVIILRVINFEQKKLKLKHQPS